MGESQCSVEWEGGGGKGKVRRGLISELGGIWMKSSAQFNTCSSANDINVIEGSLL